MKKQKETNLKADLKHDTMEFSAATDGDDRLDTDDPRYEEEDITAEELDIMEDVPENQAFALNAVETDRQVDDDNLDEETQIDDWNQAEDDDEIEETQKNHPRK